MTTGIQCCYKCPDRHPGCHAKCERYQKEHADYLRRKEIEIISGRKYIISISLTALIIGGKYEYPLQHKFFLFWRFYRDIDFTHHIQSNEMRCYRMENALDKYCPLNPSEDQALLCSGEKCAWWGEDSQACLAVALVRAIKKRK